MARRRIVARARFHVQLTEGRNTAADGVSEETLLALEVLLDLSAEDRAILLKAGGSRIMDALSYFCPTCGVTSQCEAHQWNVLPCGCHPSTKCAEECDE